MPSKQFYETECSACFSIVFVGASVSPFCDLQPSSKVSGHLSLNVEHRSFFDIVLRKCVTWSTFSRRLTSLILCPFKAD